MILMSYFKNVLKYRRDTTTVLLCSTPSNKDIERISSRRDIRFLVKCKNFTSEQTNVYYVNVSDYSPAALKDINYALYSGKDMEIKKALLASGISVVSEIDDIDFDNPQTSLERVENFELAKSLTRL